MIQVDKHIKLNEPVCTLLATKGRKFKKQKFTFFHFADKGLDNLYLLSPATISSTISSATCNTALYEMAVHLHPQVSDGAIWKPKSFLFVRHCNFQELEGSTFEDDSWQNHED